MNFAMRKKLVFVTLVLLLAVILSGCAGGPVRGTTWAGLTATDSTAYLADGSFVYAVNLNDGTQAWQYPAKANSKQVFYTTPVLTPEGYVIVGSSGTDHVLVAINPNDKDPETGSPREAWAFSDVKDHWVAAPLIVGDKLFAPNSDGNLYVLNLADGQSVKKAEKVIELGGRLWAKPTADAEGKRIFVTSLDHSVVAIDTTTYEVLWHVDLDAAIPDSVVVGADGLLYVGTLDSKFEKFDPATGEHETVLTMDGWLWGTPTVNGDTIYIADLTGKVYSYNSSTGAVDWSTQPDGAITASPVILPGSILIATESGKTEDDPGSLYAISLDGKSILWNEAISGERSGKIYSTPVVTKDLILVAPLGADGYLYAYNLEGREASWSPFTPGK